MSGTQESDHQPKPVPVLPPRLVDPVPLAAVGIVVFAVTFVVLAIGDLTHGTPLHGWTWVALAGIFVGLFGLTVGLWQRRANHRGSRTAQRL